MAAVEVFISTSIHTDQEFEKGKAAIAVGTLEKLPGIIDALIKAVRAGELDEQLKQLGKFGRAVAARKTA